MMMMIMTTMIVMIIVIVFCSSVNRNTYFGTLYYRPVPVAAYSKAWVCGRLLAGIAGSYPAGSMEMSVFCEYCEFSGKGLCIGLITLPEESYRMWCV